MLFVWTLKDIVVLGCLGLVSFLLFAMIRTLLPLAGTLTYMILTIRVDNQSIQDFLIYATRYLFGKQFYIW